MPSGGLSGLRQHRTEASWYIEARLVCVNERIRTPYRSNRLNQLSRSCFLKRIIFTLNVQGEARAAIVITYRVLWKLLPRTLDVARSRCSTERRPLDASCRKRTSELVTNVTWRSAVDAINSTISDLHLQSQSSKSPLILLVRSPSRLRVHH